VFGYEICLKFLAGILGEDLCANSWENARIDNVGGRPVCETKSCVFHVVVNGTFAHPQVPLDRIRADDRAGILVSNGAE
jgi:hypothetical protein